MQVLPVKTVQMHPLLFRLPEQRSMFCVLINRIAAFDDILYDMSRFVKSKETSLDFYDFIY